MRRLQLSLVIGYALLCATACTSPNPMPQKTTAAPAELIPDIDPEARALAEREMVRRQQAMQDAVELIEDGDRMRAAGDLEGATRAYQRSLEMQPR